MNWILHLGLRLTDRLLRRKQKNASSELEKMRSDLAMRYRDVLAACRSLESVADPVALARDYLNALFTRETQTDWWRENGVYLAQPWFIWDYGVAHNFIQPPSPAHETPFPLRVLRPESGARGVAVQLQLTREIAAPDHGRIRLFSACEDERYASLIVSMGYRTKDGVCARTIDSLCAPIVDRAVDLAVALLENGYSVCVDEPLLEDRILRRDFAPEQKYWVVAAPPPDKLKLVYPRDPRLHQYVCMAGGRWNGAYVEFPICNADRLEELMRLYGFRADAEAQHRLDLWRQALDQATVYRRRGGKTRESVSAQDVFQALLKRNPPVLEDLLENDE